MLPSDPALRVQVRPPRQTATGGSPAVVQLAGELDLAGVPLLRKQLATLLAGFPVPLLVVDLEQLAFADIVGVSGLLHLQQRVAAQGGRVVLQRPTPPVRRVLELLHLEQRLPVE